MNAETPWQLRMFKKSLKKKMRFAVLKKHLQQIGTNEKCLLVTCGDNNGAMNYFLRELGGKWSFADLEDTCVAEMSELLNQEVPCVPDDELGFPDAYFDRIITIDVHEHLDDFSAFSEEIRRIAKPRAQVICTVPNGDESKIAVRIKERIGMGPEAYGHKRVGLTMDEMKAEMLELTINFAYVKLLAKRSAAPVEEGQIAPATKDQLKSVEKTYKLYSLIYPIYWLISRFDGLLFFTEGYVIVVEGRRSATV
jgi:SAM-dependent methyltransferase